MQSILEQTVKTLHEANERVDVPHATDVTPRSRPIEWCKSTSSC